MKITQIKLIYPPERTYEMDEMYFDVNGEQYDDTEDLGYYGRTMPLIMVKQCHSKRYAII